MLLIGFVIGRWWAIPLGALALILLLLTRLGFDSRD
jgi:hypothetical protein